MRPGQFRVDLRDDQTRAIERGVQMLDAKPRIVEPGVVRAADLKQHYIDHQPARGDKAGNVGDIRWDYVIGAVRKMKTAGAGTTQRRNRDVRMLCREDPC